MSSEQTSIRMDNSGSSKLQVPGFNDVPLTFALPWAERFAHGMNDYGQVPAVTAREFAMTATMNVITDQPGWSEDILNSNQQAIAAWKVRAFETEALMSEKAWAWCLAELHDKALEFREKGFCRVLDTGSCVCKTDTMIEASVSTALQEGLRSLNGKPRPNEQVQLAIDPFLYPLVYGETRVLDQGVVPLPRSSLDLENMLMSARRSLQTRHHPSFDTADDEEMNKMMTMGANRRRKGSYYYYGMGNFDPSQYYWSARYQSLPFDTKFDDEGNLRITSYVNNLHPKHRGAYTALDKIASASVQLWNQVLIKNQPFELDEETGTASWRSCRQRGRHPLRILTFGVEWHNTMPSWARSFMRSHIEEIKSYQNAKAIVGDSKYPSYLDGETDLSEAYDIIEDLAFLEGVTLPAEPNEETWKLAEEYLGRKLNREDDQGGLEYELKHEAFCRRSWVHPNPGTAFTYEDWKAGRNVDRAVVNMIVQPLDHSQSQRERGLPLHDRYDIRLEETFRDTGLQMIAKAGTLHADLSNTASTDWCLDGHLNEHIIGVACYVYEIENVHFNISFAQQTYMTANAYRFKGESQVKCVRDDPASYQYDPRRGVEDLNALATILGFELGHTLTFYEHGGNTEMPVQETGTISLPQGRLIAFPSILEYNLQTSLIDPELGSGHARYVLLYLVDPNYRICSTSNVPPQQHEWWTAIIAELLSKKGLPQELVDLIMSFYEPPMSHDRAEEHSRAMQKEDAWLKVARHTGMTTFGFSQYPL